MAQFVRCSACGKPYLDKGGGDCPHCARVRWGVTSSEPIRALRARLTQEARVMPADTARRKVAVLAAFGGVSVALVTWLLVLLFT